MQFNEMIGLVEIKYEKKLNHPSTIKAISAAERIALITLYYAFSF